MTDGSSLTFSVGKIALPPFIQPTPCSHSRLLKRRQAASIAKRANSTVGTRRLAASIAKRTNSTVGMRRLAASISKTLPPRRRLACYALGDKVPDTAAAAFIAPSASIIGAVDVAEDASVWYNCTIRGDVASISIGPRTNIQDNTVIHVDSDALGGSGSTPTIIGADCTIGHMALLHACTLGDGAFVGMNATLMSHTTIEPGGMLAAGALLTAGKTVGRGELWGGAPAKFMRPLKPGEAAFILESARAYVGFARTHAAGIRELPSTDEAATAATSAPRWR